MTLSPRAISSRVNCSPRPDEQPVMSQVSWVILECGIRVLIARLSDKCSIEGGWVLRVRCFTIKVKDTTSF